MPTSFCPKCGGFLVTDFEIRCLNCGYIRYTTPSPSPRTLTRVKSTRGLAHSDITPAPSHTRVQSAEESCVANAYKILRGLKPPFLQTFGGEGLLGKAPLPCFFFSSEYRKITEGIFAPWSLQEDGYLARWKKIAEAIVCLPMKMRGPVWLILCRCDSRMREATTCCDAEVRFFHQLIKREKRRIGTLQTAAQQTTLFPFSLNEALLRYCTNTKERLDEATDLVEKARLRLEPAKTFFLNQHSPTRSEAKHKLLKKLLSLSTLDRRKAAAKAADLLKLADPKRSATADSIRNL